MKDVGLVTYYGDNYGACLQAYALFKSIKDLGYGCEIINYTDVVKKNDKKIKSNKISKAVREYLLSGHPFKRYKLGKQVRAMNANLHIKCNEFRDAYLSFTKENYDEKKLYENAPDFDSFVCGSDQIWNPNFYDRCHPIYFLDFVSDKKKKIAYAPSMGIKTVPTQYQSDLKKYLDKLDDISVRESTTIGELQKYTDKEINWVLDPTLLLNRNDYRKFDRSLPNNIEGPYVFCYIFGKQKNIKSIKNEIKKITGLKTVCIPFVDREFMSNDIKVTNAGPEDFVNLIKNASLVVTDSFHATAFSINLNVPFISMLRQDANDKNEMSSRLYSILNKVELEDRLVKTVDEIPEDLFGVNFENANKKLEQYRKESIGYLKGALE